MPEMKQGKVQTSSLQNESGASSEQERIAKLNAEVQAIEEQAKILRDEEKAGNSELSDVSKEASGAKKSDAVSLAATPAALRETLLERDIKSLRSRTSFLGVLTLIAIAACVGGTVYFSQNLSKTISASDALRLSSEQSSVRANKVLDAFSAQGTRIDELLAANSELQKNASSLKGSLEALEKRLKTAEDSLSSANDRLKRYEERNPDDWKIAQAYFLVSSAFRMAVFSDDLTSAMWCLKDADSMLEGIEDPDVINVRKAISSDTLKLSGIPGVDRRGISFKLDSVYSNIDSMPVHDMAREEKADPEKTEADNLGWKDNLKNSFERFISRFIEIHRRDDKVVNNFLSPEQTGTLKQNIRSLILLAKQSLYQGDQVAYHNNIQQARDLISGYFDSSSETVKANLNALDSISANTITVDAPSVLSSYSMFREIARKRLGLLRTGETENKVSDNQTPQASGGSNK